MPTNKPINPALRGLPALVENLRVNHGLDVPPVEPIATPPAHWEHVIRNALVAHLGSENAADAYLDSTRMGYPTTARDAIREGWGEVVMDDLEGQWGPSPHYS